MCFAGKVPTGHVPIYLYVRPMTLNKTVLIVIGLILLGYLGIYYLLNIFRIITVYKDEISGGWIQPSVYSHSMVGQYSIGYGFSPAMYVHGLIIGSKAYRMRIILKYRGSINDSIVW